MATARTLLLCVAVVALAGCSSTPTGNNPYGGGQQVPNRDLPHVAFTMDDGGSEPGGTLTVASIENGPVQYANVAVGGASGPSCSWTTQSNGQTMAAGDTLTCTDPGRITISDNGSQTLLYSGSFT